MCMCICMCVCARVSMCMCVCGCVCEYVCVWTTNIVRSTNGAHIVQNVADCDVFSVWCVFWPLQPVDEAEKLRPWNWLGVCNQLVGKRVRYAVVMLVAVIVWAYRSVLASVQQTAFCPALLWGLHIWTYSSTPYDFTVKLLKTKRRLLYVRNQSVPRWKHFQPRL
jgi:hypothetical protein